MAIPQITSMRRPVLHAHGDGTAKRTEDLVEVLGPGLGLTQDELEARQPSGDYVFVQRLNWAREALVHVGALERTTRGVTTLTAEGRDLIDGGGEPPSPPNDWASQPVTRDAVLSAVEEFRRDGRDTVLRRHGFRRALDYVVFYEGEEFDSKALYAIAHGYDHPDEPSLRVRGLQGGGLLLDRLRELGFEVRSRRERAGSGSRRAWMVRAGQDGRYEALALGQQVIVIGWSELGPTSPGTSRDELKQRIADTYDEHRPMSLAGQAGQVFRFANEIQEDDVVVLPLTAVGGHVAVGRVIGEYEWKEDGPFAGTDAKSTRSVEWLAESLPYERFDADLREAFGGRGTVREISKADAVRRLLDAVEGADASAIHLVMKWSATHGAETLIEHQEMAEGHGASWWARVGTPDRAGLAETWLNKLRAQLGARSETHVYLSGGGEVWRTELLDITDDRDDVESDLVPFAEDPAVHYSLWLKLARFVPSSTAEITDRYVLAQSGEPVSQGALSNQGPLIIRRHGVSSAKPPPPEGAFDLAALRTAASAVGLALPDDLYCQVLAALESGKHIILTGPPGTAKTSLAQIVAETAAAADRCDGHVLTTATADWTTYETIGGLRPSGPDRLEFVEGHFLAAIRDRRWLIIDELNRSHFDRAFGQLFTVLSGQSVVLPYHRPGQLGPLTLVPEGRSSPLPDADVLTVPQDWRVIATMNVFDKSLLFEMSFALMRRFAFIEVASPSHDVFTSLIDRESTGDPEAARLAKQLLVLRTFKDLGPAVFLDLSRFLRERRALPHDGDGQLLFEAFYSYLLPQFEGIDAATGERLFAQLAPMVGTAARRGRLRATLNAVLGLELAGIRSQGVEDPDDDAEFEDLVEQPPP